MKKVLFVLAVVLLTACGSTSTEVAPTQDSLISTATDSVTVDSLKEIN